jgi:hypothetical protein
MEVSLTAEASRAILAPPRRPDHHRGMDESGVRALLDAVLQDAGGAPTTLCAQLGAGATAVVFLRHFG